MAITPTTTEYYGVHEVRGERDGKPYGPVLGKYFIVWRREPEGWRMHLDMWNAAAAQTVTARLRVDP
jgi:hypothetical protein